MVGQVSTAQKKVYFEKTHEKLVNQIGQSKLAKNNEVLNFKSKTNGKSIVATKIDPLQMVNSNQTV
jgi:hypothetical protein